jgi:hypothetical protein
MHITNCFGPNLSFERFETGFVQASFWLLLIALPVALFYVSEALRRTAQSHQRQSILGLKF